MSEQIIKIGKTNERSAKNVSAFSIEAHAYN